MAEADLKQHYFEGRARVFRVTVATVERWNPETKTWDAQTYDRPEAWFNGSVDARSISAEEAADLTLGDRL